MEASEHVLMDIRIDRFDPIGDVCKACSNEELGIWVPVSFCTEAKADADRYYDEIEKGYLGLLIERGKNAGK